MFYFKDFPSRYLDLFQCSPRVRRNLYEQWAAGSTATQELAMASPLTSPSMLTYSTVTIGPRAPLLSYLSLLMRHRRLRRSILSITEPVSYPLAMKRTKIKPVISIPIRIFLRSSTPSPYKNLLDPGRAQRQLGIPFSLRDPHHCYVYMLDLSIDQLLSFYKLAKVFSQQTCPASLKVE